ncbi:MAG: hypothetical protein CMH49_05275, partial [Myxococcales bacterium]|nr:hypothetical protein [Myxococcales bacterium]
NEAVHTFRLNQAQADLTRGSNALIDAEHILKDLLKFPKEYDDFFSVCAPNFLKIRRKLYAKVKEQRNKLKTLEASINESLSDHVTDAIHSFRVDAHELRNRLRVVNALQVSLPAFNEVREAYSLMQHDILPFSTHLYRAEIKPNVEFLPLPLEATSLDQELHDLFGDQLPWHFVNYEVLSDPTLWPLLGRETPYLLKLLAPDWPQEWHEWCQGERSVPLPETHRRSLRWRVEESLNMWGTQLLGIYLMTLRYGPAGTQALIEELRSNGHLNDKKLVLVGSQRKRRGFQTRHAPLAIQMEVSLSTLRMNGYLRDADQIENKWRSMIGNELRVMVNTGKTIPFPLDLISTKIKGWVELLHQHAWSSWRGERFESLSGLTLSRGQWGQVKAQAEQVISADPSLVLSAQTKWVALAYAAQKSPAHLARIFKAAESLHFDDQIWSKDGEKRHVNDTSSDREDLIAALALADLFSRRTPGQLQRF